MRCAASTGFKYIDRSKPATIVLVPGWASDYRIFNALDLEYNYLMPMDFSPFSFTEELIETLEGDGISKVSLFGWSLGGFAAAEFARKHPTLVDELILVSVRRRYRREGLDDIRRYLKRSREGYLYKFYSQCFYNKERLAHFKEGLLKNYLKELDMPSLLSGLDYLEGSKMEPESLKGINSIKILHGINDRIAPIDEALDVRKGLNRVKFISVEDTGHIPFLETEIKEIL
jgi:pimeloyl-ACP methyl ester carboxylesterase